jgi:hypothetical protein
MGRKIVMKKECGKWKNCNEEGKWEVDIWEILKSKNRVNNTIKKGKYELYFIVSKWVEIL